MKRICFTEEFCQPENLFPFTLTRQIQDLRVGGLTIREKWELALGLGSVDRDEGDYKDGSRGFHIEAEALGDDELLLIHGNILPSPELIKLVRKLKPGEFISLPEKESVVYCISRAEVEEPNRIRMRKPLEFEGEVREIRYPWDLFQLNGWAIGQDVALLARKRDLARPSSTNTLVKPRNIHIEKGAQVEYAHLNATEGPIYIAAGAVVMEGCYLRGPLYIGEGAVVKMGTRIYGATTIGPGCTAGGEIKNSVMMGYSNKAHDGYLGDSVLGYWCNLGAGTSNSNVKNTASDVRVWTRHGQVPVGLKCGVLMGDHSRTAINTSINTGTVIGVCCNVFGNGLTPKYIPSFSWGSEGVQRYSWDKALQDIRNWMRLKGQEPDSEEEFILKHIFDHY